MAMGTARPLASLSSGLLARKGHARPAMRAQGFVDLAGPAGPAALEDLGWNDMGSTDGGAHDGGWADTPAVPPVIAVREALRDSIEAPAAPRPEPVPAATPSTPFVRAVSPATAARIGRESAALTARGKAAFTLRLDAARHLRLRLASAVADRSAQALVTEALDHFLQTMPAVAQLAEQLPGPTGRSRR